MDTTPETRWPSPSTIWQVRMLGRFEVISPDGTAARFRSKTAASLLAYLCIHKDRELSRFELEQQFWPESDGDRQAQNLRRAVSDIRTVLEEGLEFGSIVTTRKNHVSLTPDVVSSDVECFLQLTSGNSDDEQALERWIEAANLYQGQLLASLADIWVVTHRAEIEERFARTIGRICLRLCSQGKAKEAIRIGRSAVMAAPLREDVHIALIAAYRLANMEPEAIRQFERLEQMLDENWGEPPSERARAALEGTLSLVSNGNDDLAETSTSLHKSGDPEFASSETPGGALPIGSRLYVRRSVDAEAEAHIAKREGVILIHGPRQVGKSSLLARMLAHARSANMAVVLSDAQAMGESELSDGGRLYQTLGQEFASQLHLDLDLDNAWGRRLGPNANLSAVIEKLLVQSEKHVCWAIDEADLLFDRAYTNDFFGLLRSWYNRRALDPDGPWKKLSFVLTYATEANLFITDLNQSPFNVGVRLNLRDFTMSEFAEFQTCFGNGMEPSSISKVFEITHGHPYLSQCAFRFLVNGGTIEELSSEAADEGGPFGSHLKHMLVSVAQSEETLNEVRRLLRGEQFEHPTTRYRLQSSGLIVLSKEGKPEFRVPAYETYLRAALG